MKDQPEFDPVSFIRTQTAVAAPSIVPEVKLHLAAEVTPLWQITEKLLKQTELPPPFWAFAWPGGQGLARYVLDHPEAVRGKHVVDLGAGSGVAAIAAMKAGAASALAIDIDLMALKAIEMNAELNGVKVATAATIGTAHVPQGADLILGGDICYQQAMAASLTQWLFQCRESGIGVLLADPGRAYVPKEGLERELASYRVPTSRDLEDQEERTVTVWGL